MTLTRQQPSPSDSLPVVSSVPSSVCRLSPRSSALQVTTARRVSDPMFSAAYSPLDRPLLAPPLRRPHRAPLSGRMAARFTARQTPSSAASVSVSSTQTLPLPVGSRRAVSRSAEVLDKMDVGVSATISHPARTRPRTTANVTSYSDDDDDIEEDFDVEYETREPATLKLVRLQTEINDRKRQLHQLLRRVNSLERTHQLSNVDRWHPDISHRADVVVTAPRLYTASPQRVPDMGYTPQRWVPARSTLMAPRLYRSLSYDTDRDAFLSQPVFDRLPPSIDQSYSSPLSHRLPRNATVTVRPQYVDPRRRYESPVYLPPPPQKFGNPDWMTWSPRRSTVYSSAAQHYHSATPKTSPRHYDSCSVRSRSSAASMHDPSTKRVLLTPDPRRTSFSHCQHT